MKYAKFAALLAALIIIAACPGNKEATQGPAQTGTTASNAPTVPENSTAMNPVAPPQADLASRRIPGAANQSVDVQLTEYAIRIEPTLAAGKYTFKIANGGKLDHSFVIDGNSVHAALAEPLKRGDVQTLDVDLSAAGTYEIHCPVDGHAGKGMTVTLTVK